MSSVGNPRRNARKRNAPATRRRALELLASCRDGCTEAIMLARGFTVDMLVDLIRAGLGTVHSERMRTGRLGSVDSAQFCSWTPLSENRT